MSNSLQEQLLKSGLVSEQKLKAVKTQRRQQTKQKKAKKKSSEEELSLAAYYAKKTQLEKIEKDKALNEAREAAKAKKALKAKVKELVVKNRCNDNEGEVIHRFVDGKRIRQVYVNTQQQTQLVQGALAIVLFNGRTHLVPRPIAEKIKLLPYEKVFFVDASDEANLVDPDDDPYAAYKIPDDLSW